MNRCATIRLTGRRAPPTCAACQPRRWATYDRASLTPDALLNKVEAGLVGDDVDTENADNARGGRLRIDADAKTISTAAGDLPISPIFDPAWMGARRRTQKSEPGPVTGRFRTKLANNPFARALATPLRRCPNTNMQLPRYFLQDFELVKHPETGAGWWAPGPLSFELVQPTVRSDEGPAAAADSAAGDSTQESTRTYTAAADKEEVSAEEKRPRRAPVTIYTLSKQDVVGAVGGPNRKFLSMITGIRTGMAMGPETREAVWRQDMGDLVLRMMRREAVDALAARANTVLPDTTNTAIQACASWEDIKDVRLRGCVLWLPKDDQEKKMTKNNTGGEHIEKDKRGIMSGASAGRRYATFDVQGVKYGNKMVVHHLRWLLGDEETRRLRDAAAVFRDSEIMVLKQWPSVSMMRLHMLLWRLQGYLAEPQTTISDRAGRELRQRWTPRCPK